MNKIYLTLLLTLTLTINVFAVTSQITRHSSAAQLIKGETCDVVIDSEGTIELARHFELIDLGVLLDRTWTINSIVADSKGNIYAGTSPNGMILKYEDKKATVFYDPLSNNDTDTDAALNEIVNEHVFAMAIDAGQRLLAAISGENCRLVRFEKSKPVTLFEPEDTCYILSIAVDKVGNIFVGTGPEGKIFRLDPFGKNQTLVYRCRDNNILSLAVDSDGYIYAGSDNRGLVYKIDRSSGKASVLFDSGQKEVTSLLIDSDGNLYATATSALADTNRKRFSGITDKSVSGRPESKPSSDSDEQNTAKTLKTPNTKPEKHNNGKQPERPKRGEDAGSPSCVYRIDPQGFVTEIFSEAAVFFALKQENNSLLLGTGNNAELFSIDLETETKSIAYQDETAAQITAIDVLNDRVYIGTANPAQLIELSTALSKEGTYISEPIDAAQPARWGKLQLNAEIPEGCSIMLAARTGNVKDPNDPTFSDWTDAVEITSATQLHCPVGRYCQYRLTLKTNDSAHTPMVREIAVPFVVDNLPPKITEIKTTLLKDQSLPGQISINYTAADTNNDNLTFTIELRQLGRQKWIKIKDDLTDNAYTWDSKTVEDGEYELRITADDKLSNTPATSLTATRISDPFIVDNSAPDIATQQVIVIDDTATLKLSISDWLTVIGNVSYTVDSSEHWTSTIPDDFVYDTTSEDFTVVAPDLAPGEHIIAVRLKDDIGNTAYKTFVVEIR